LGLDQRWRNPKKASAAVLLLLLLARGVRAQDPIDPPKKPPQGRPAGTARANLPAGAEIREAKPDLFYLLDRNGALVPVLDMGLEEFQRLYDRDRGGSAAAAPPAYSIQRLEVTGTVDGSRVRLAIVADILLKKSEWVRIPLRFADAIVRALPSWDGSGKHFLHYEPTEGYLWWVEGGENRARSLRWEMELPIRELAGERRLHFTAPRATTSELRITFPFRQVMARVSEGSGLLPLEHPTPDSTELTVVGIGGEFQLNWRQAEEGTVPDPVLESASNIQFHVFDPRQVRVDARIRLSSSRGTLGPFRIRLPAGMRLESGDESGYTMINVEDQATGSVLEIRPDGRAASPWEFRLRGEIVPHESLEAIAINGFEIDGAVRQVGTVEITVEDGWKVELADEANIRRVDSLPSEVGSRTSERCEFSRQPFSARLRIRKINPIRVEPSHMLTISPEQVVLESTFAYQVVGRQVSQVEIDMSGWTVDNVAPESIVAVDRILKNESSLLTVPLVRNAANPGRFELRVIAHREIPEGGSTVDVTLPRALAAAGTTASLVVAPLDNIELNPRVRELSGLIPDSVPRPANLGPRQQQALFYRERIDARETRFVADFQIRRRTVEVTSRDLLRVENHRISVEQRSAFRVAYEPLAQVTLQIPDQARELGDPQVMLEASGSDPITLTGDSAPGSLPSGSASSSSPPVAATFAAESGINLVTYKLPIPRMGAFELVVRYAIGRSAVGEASAISETVPLVRALPTSDFKLGPASLSITAVPGWEFELADDEWTVRSGASGALPATEMSLTSSTNSPRILLLSRRRETKSNGMVLLHRLWVQSWFGSQLRSERYVARLTCSADFLSLRMPPSTVMDELLITLNGMTIRPTIMEGGLLRIELPPEVPRNDCLLEMFYTIPRQSNWFGRTSVTFPRISSAVAPQQTYWHVVSSARELLLDGPPSFSTHATWRWRNFFWDRQASISPTELERWLQAPTLEASRSNTNQYLFSTLGSEVQTQIQFGSLATLVLLFGGVVFALGMFATHLPPSRYPSIPVALAILGFFVVGIWPDMATLVLQAAAVGLILAMIGAGLRGLVLRRQARRVVVHGATSTDSQSRFRRRESGITSGTTSPISLQMPAVVEPKR